MPYLFKARFSVIAVIKSTYSGGPVLKTPVSTVGGTSSVPGWETKIPHAIQLKKEICFLNKEIYKLKKKKTCIPPEDLHRHRDSTKFGNP